MARRLGVFVVLLVTVSSQFSRAQGIEDTLAATFASIAGMENTLLSESPPLISWMPADTVSKPAPRLLPEMMSPMEHILWGEHGLMRTTGIAPYTVEARKSELGARRFMLTAHQIGGFVTLGLFIPTLVYGQKNINNWNAATSGMHRLDRSVQNTHETFAVLTFSAYMTTAALAIFSPPPLLRRDEWSSVTFHKTLAWIHFAGMTAIPFLAMAASHAQDAHTAQSLRKAHQITAYVTAGAFATAMIVITF